ncbi:D-glycero-beta-D-manno-heptose-7-phosphate kinase [Helicobacter rodentium]|uniref:D-glycero-beta-D-manno-heptose-7-phosphate kinase n=1 Tax=Helicobacter rodentium TaxID=59617 RepID=UPI002353375C|nr:D-glycero-beta-D-manno-heptose-7-phosphate kinase [Helicobacter rodentium]
MKPNILVVGDLILDHYIWGNCERISPEAPVQVIDVKRESLNLGGACNVANNLISLESNVWICGMVGCDEAGNTLKQELKNRGIKIEGIFSNPLRPTTQKSRLIAAHQQVVRIDREDKSPICQEGEKFILDFVEHTLVESKLQCLVLSDYQKGVLSESLTQSLIALAKAHNLKILIDPKGKDYTKYKGATLLTPNKKEAIQATGINICDEDSLQDCIVALQKMCALEVSLITLSEDGIAFADSIQEGSVKVERMPTIAREVFDVTGAGDTVIASLAYMLALGKPVSQSVYFANAAAAVVVSKVGSATASKKEIFAYLRRNNLLDSALVNAEFLKIFDEESCLNHLSERMVKIFKRQKLLSYWDKWIKAEELNEFLESLRQLKEENFKIVFTNGCFDILHLGHIDYLHKARNLGDLLIVGLNSDSSITHLKGTSRPINEEKDRIAMLCALECVDFVVVFSEETPRELIAKIRPHTLVKGADYANKEVVGREFSEEVRLIEFIEGKSTSQLIQKIKES